VLSLLGGIAENMIKDIINKKEYDFLNTDEHLRGKQLVMPLSS